MGKRRENVLEAAVGWTNGAREKMGWKKFGRRRVGSERREGIGWECSGRVEGRGRSEVIGLGAVSGVGERVRVRVRVRVRCRVRVRVRVRQDKRGGGGEGGGGEGGEGGGGEGGGGGGEPRCF